MTNLMPQIGMRGVYTLLSPFNTALIVNTPYTCMAIRRISDIVAAGGSPEADYYTPLGLDSITYKADVLAGVCIISLQVDSGETVYVPSSYVDGFPDIGGIPYTSLILAISIGAVPDSMNLSYIKTKITDTVLENIGVNAIVNVVAVSHPTIVSNADHVTIEAARQSKVSIISTDYSKYLEAVSQRDSALVTIQELEKYILSNKLV